MIGNVNGTIRDKMLSREFSDQQDLDRSLIKLDGSNNKSRLGANALLAVSLATAHATAASAGIPLFRHLGEGVEMPVPMMNIINGGAQSAAWSATIASIT